MSTQTKVYTTVIAFAVVAVGAAVYFLWPGASGIPGGPNGIGSNGTGPNGTEVPAVIPVPNTPVPASSYGKGAEGSSSTSADNLMVPKASDAVGILQGTAKLAAGAKLDLSAVKVSLSDPKTKEVLKTESVSATGSYSFTVLPGEYILNVVAGTGTSAQLPQRISIGPNQRSNVNFFVQ